VDLPLSVLTRKEDATHATRFTYTLNHPTLTLTPIRSCTRISPGRHLAGDLLVPVKGEISQEMALFVYDRYNQFLAGFASGKFTISREITFLAGYYELSGMC